MNQYFTPLAYFCYHYIFENKFHSPFLIVVFDIYIIIKLNIHTTRILMVIFRLIKIHMLYFVKLYLAKLFYEYIFVQNKFILNYKKEKFTIL